LELLRCPEREAALVVLAHVPALVEGGTELGGQYHPPLGVQGVLVPPKEPGHHLVPPRSCRAPAVLPFAPQAATIRPYPPPVNPPMTPSVSPPPPPVPPDAGVAGTPGGATMDPMGQARSVVAQLNETLNAHDVAGGRRLYAAD